MPPLPSADAHRPRDASTSESTNNDGAAFAISPSLIVGICILAAIFFCVILASIFRLCTRDTGSENTENLYRPSHPDQLERMSEVRRINNKMAWERGMWAKRELVKQGRRLTVGWEEGMESLSMLEGQNGYDTAHNQYNDDHHDLHRNQYLHPNDHQLRGDRGYRESYIPMKSPQMHPQAEDLNPYANRASRVSKLLRTKRVKHDADDSDDEEIDMDAFPHLQMAGLPPFVTRSREGLKGSPANEEGRYRHPSMKKKESMQAHARDEGESQAYLGPAIKKMSSGLEDAGAQGQGQGQRQVLRRPRPLVLGMRRALRTWELTPPEASPTVSAGLMRADRGGFEDVSLDDGGVNSGRCVSEMLGSDDGDGDFDVKSETTVKPTTAADGRVEYEEDYTTLPSPTPINTVIPLPPPTHTRTIAFTPTQGRGDTELHHDCRDQHQNEPRTPTNPRPPIIMINDDASDPSNPTSFQARGRAKTPHDYLGPLINIGNEAGAGDINDIQVFEPREAGNLGGRYWNSGGR